MNSTDQEKKVWCCNCYEVSVPRYSVTKKKYLIKGFWLGVGLPSKEILCRKCLTWVDAVALYDVK